MLADKFMGWLMICLGLLMLLGRLRKIEVLQFKLKTLQERSGSTAGSVLHFIVYILVPIGIGILLVTRGPYLGAR